MPTSQYQSADFTAFVGAISIGYRLHNADGTPNGSRVTAGINQPVAGVAIYGATVALPDGFAGAIVWDTGGSTPAYAAESINPEAAGTGGTAGDPWATELPGDYAPGTAGAILGAAGAQAFDGIARGGSTNSITLADAAGLDLAGTPIVIVAGTGFDQSRVIVGYDPTTKVATVDRGWTIAPDDTSRYLLGFTGWGARLDLAQPVPNVTGATLGGALHGAWATAWGKVVIDPIARLLSVFGVAGFIGSTPAAKIFTLDDADNPTTRTPQ